jgi:MYXO-CTERM domain-containing protein
MRAFLLAAVAVFIGVQASASTLVHEFGGSQNLTSPPPAGWQTGGVAGFDPALGSLTGVQIDISATFNVASYSPWQTTPGPLSQYAGLEFWNPGLGGTIASIGVTHDGFFNGFYPSATTHYDLMTTTLITDAAFLNEVVGPGPVLLNWLAIGPYGDASFKLTWTYFIDEEPGSASIPLPATGLMLLAGLGLLAMRRRRS